MRGNPGENLMTPLSQSQGGSIDWWDWLLQIGGALVLFILTMGLKDVRKKFKMIEQIPAMRKELRAIKRHLGMEVEEDD